MNINDSSFDRLIMNGLTLICLCSPFKNMSPKLPDKDMAARELWSPKEGLEQMTDKNFQITEPESESWLVLVEQQWQLFSAKDDLCDSDNAVRQKLLDAVEKQQSLDLSLSHQRCLAVIETGDRGQWRL